MAKKFYVMQQVLKRNKTYGYNTVSASVYQIANDGTPCLVHAFQFKTGAIPGIRNLVLQELVKAEVLPKKYEKTDYYNQDTVKIFELT